MVLWNRCSFWYTARWSGRRRGNRWRASWPPAGMPRWCRRWWMSPMPNRRRGGTSRPRSPVRSPGYPRFSPAYRQAADEARERGWPVTEIPGEHLHQIVAPAAVAATLVRFVESATGPDPVRHNRAAWDREVETDNEWTRPVSAD